VGCDKGEKRFFLPDADPGSQSNVEILTLTKKLMVYQQEAFIEM